MNQLFCALRFYAFSGHFHSVANFIGMCESTASQIVLKVSQELAQLYQQKIRMPGVQEIIKEQHKLYEQFGIPKTIGVVDSTHVKVQNPGW